MRRFLLFVLGGYLCGSVLFARVAGFLFRHRDVTANSPDRNPGTYNAFACGGMAVGLFTLCGDVLKGFLPVSLYLKGDGVGALSLALVLAAPVLGHLFPLYWNFHGGKGIAVTFGCLLGLSPALRPFFLLAAVFLFFSLIVKITPNYHRTLLTYLTCEVLVLLTGDKAVSIGFSIIALSVCLRLLKSPEEKGTCQVKPIWTH